MAASVFMRGLFPSNTIQKYQMPDDSWVTKLLYHLELSVGGIEQGQYWMLENGYCGVFPNQSVYTTPVDFNPSGAFYLYDENPIIGCIQSAGGGNGTYIYTFTTFTSYGINRSPVTGYVFPKAWDVCWSVIDIATSDSVQNGMDAPDWVSFNIPD
jgi:hypothetical protein